MIPIEQTILQLWHLLRADSPLGARARRRATATSAMAIAVLALFVSVGLVTIVLVVCAMVVSAGSLLAAALLLHRHRARLRGLGLRLWDRGAEITLRAASRTVPALRRVGAHASAGPRTAQGLAPNSAVEAPTRGGELPSPVRSVG